MLRSLCLGLLALAFAPTALAQSVPCVDGFAGEFSCNNVDLMARLPLNATPEFFESSSDIWGWTDPQTGVEYAIINQYDHTAFVDLSEPTEPFVVGTLVAPSQSVARDAKVYADHAFIGTDSGFAPLQVFDLTRLRDVTSPPVVFTADAVYDGTDPHNLAIDEVSGFAYLVYTGSGPCSSGLHIVDVRTPQSPTYAGCFDYPSSEFHDLQCVTYDGPDPDYEGAEVCFGPTSGAGTLAIVDVTDKAAPTLIAEIPYPNAAYSHQGWLTEDRRYFLLDDEFDEANFGFNSRTVVFDVSDLDAPSVAFEHFGEAASTDHNLFVRDGYAFQANYRSGLRVLDLAGIEMGTLSEAAFFDTHPESDATGFDGVFGVYPFFESGIVVVSDMARGLFVLQPQLGVVTGAETSAPSGEATLEAYPNPAAGRAEVAVAVPSAQAVSVAVYDVLGRRVAELFAGPMAAGERKRFSLDATGLPAGAYLVRAEGETFRATRSLTVAR